MTTAPAGWYPDPRDANNERWWDGANWSEEHVRPAQQQAAPQAQGAPPAYPAAYPTQYPGSWQQAEAAPASPGNTLSIIGIVLGVIALVFCPILLGPAGIVLGVIGRNKKESLGTAAIIVGIVGLIGGMAISITLYTTFYR